MKLPPPMAAREKFLGLFEEREESNFLSPLVRSFVCVHVLYGRISFLFFNRLGFVNMSVREKGRQCVAFLKKLFHMLLRVNYFFSACGKA